MLSGTKMKHKKGRKMLQRRKMGLYKILLMCYYIFIGIPDYRWNFTNLSNLTGRDEF